MTVTTGGGSGVNGFLSGSPGGEYSLLTSFFKLCAFSHFRLPTSGGSNYPVTKGGDSGVNSFLTGINGFLSRSPGRFFKLRAFSHFVRVSRVSTKFIS